MFVWIAIGLLAFFFLSFFFFCFWFLDSSLSFTSNVLENEVILNKDVDGSRKLLGFGIHSDQNYILECIPLTIPRPIFEPWPDPFSQSMERDQSLILLRSQTDTLSIAPLLLPRCTSAHPTTPSNTF